MLLLLMLTDCITGESGESVVSVLSVVSDVSGVSDVSVVPEVSDVSVVFDVSDVPDVSDVLDVPVVSSASFHPIPISHPENSAAPITRHKANSTDSGKMVRWTLLLRVRLKKENMVYSFPKKRSLCRERQSAAWRKITGQYGRQFSHGSILEA
jgi:hypothetical protein